MITFCFLYDVMQLNNITLGNDPTGAGFESSKLVSVLMLASFERSVVVLQRIHH